MASLDDSTILVRREVSSCKRFLSIAQSRHRASILGVRTPFTRQSWAPLLTACTASSSLSVPLKARMGLPFTMSCTHRMVSSPLLSGSERSSNTAATSRCTKEAAILPTRSTHSRWYSRFSAPASISRIRRSSSGLSSTNRIFTRPESISSVPPWGGACPR